MCAARLLAGRTNLSVEEVPDPELRPGCAIVRIETVFMSPYMASLVGLGRVRDATAPVHARHGRYWHH